MTVPGKPWRSFATPEPGRTYVALATELHLTRWRRLPAFARHTLGSVRQLASSPGAMGYSLRAAPHRRRFWTVTVWEDEAAMRRYVREQPHRAAMRWLQASDGGTFRSTQWDVDGAAVPPSWEVAGSQLAAS